VEGITADMYSPLVIVMLATVENVVNPALVLVQSQKYQVLGVEIVPPVALDRVGGGGVIADKY
jgi:hypothetical protein